MRASDLSTAQARRLKDQAAAKLRWFNRLVERMTKMGWDPCDDLYQAALRAQAAVHELHVRAHYAGVKHGVGKEADGWSERVVKRALDSCRNASGANGVALHNVVIRQLNIKIPLDAVKRHWTWL